MQILELLLKEPGLTHNEIVRKLGRGNRNRTLKAINNLVKQRYIREEVKGRRRLCFLTEKGRSKLVNEAVEKVNEGLNIVKNISAMLLAEKSKFEEWRRANREALMNVKITEDMPLEERIRRILAEEKRTFGLLTDAYKNMHTLILEGSEVYQKLKQFSPELDPSQFFIGFPDGYLYLVHVSFLKEKGLYEKFKSLMP
ncbi:MAG: hypothetical protein QXK93_08570 [Candidatus Bathyarchaeia archaeon]